MWILIYAVGVVFVFLMFWVLCVFSAQQQEEVERDYRRLREEGADEVKITAELAEA